MERELIAKKKIALLGIYHETNTFIDTPTTLGDFKNGYWLKGEAIRAEYQGAHHEISGVIDVIDRCDDLELVPVLYVSATPGGLIEENAYTFILDELFCLLNEVLPVEGCIVVPHGAGVAQEYGDMDGHWLRLLREKIGDQIPVTGTLDLHANVSEEMTSATNALVAYSTNPHIDQYDTGRRAAELMVAILRGKIQPVQKLVQLPLAISIEQQNTSADPCRNLLAQIRQTQHQYELLSASLLLGFPYADVAEMGSSFILIADQSNALYTDSQLDQAGAYLEEEVMLRKELFNGEKMDISGLLGDIANAEKPVLLLDMGDNVGGGAPGDSTYLLRFLENDNVSSIFVCINNPAEVTNALESQNDGFFYLELPEYRSLVSILQITDGVFTEDTPKHGGFVNYDMGPTAIVKTDKGNTIMLTSKRTPPYSLRQMTAMGLSPEAFDIIVAKGVNAPIAAYSQVCPSVIQVDTPGVTQADMTLFTYKNRRKPLFPFE